jgi:hypothetical protein
VGARPLGVTHVAPMTHVGALCPGLRGEGEGRGARPLGVTRVMSDDPNSFALDSSVTVEDISQGQRRPSDIHRPGARTPQALPPADSGDSPLLVAWNCCCEYLVLL